MIKIVENNSFNDFVESIHAKEPYEYATVPNADTLCRKFKVFFANGQPVISDIDIEDALDYMYGTDRDKAVTFSREEVQKAIYYYDYKH